MLDIFLLKRKGSHDETIVVTTSGEAIVVSATAFCFSVCLFSQNYMIRDTLQYIN